MKESNKSLHGIKMIKKYFTTDKTRNMITAIYYSKRYYGSEVCHLPGLARNLHNDIKFASANAIKKGVTNLTVYNAHTEIHALVTSGRC